MRCKKSGSKMRIPLIVGIFILSLLILPMIISKFINQSNTGEKLIRKYLENKYNEKFDNITLVQSVENPDTDINCDGSNFGTINGKGNTEYYLVYSARDDLEFVVNYDTHTKEYEDTYDFSLSLRKNILQLYKETQNTYSDYISEVNFYANKHDENETPTKIYSTQDLNGILSKVTDGYPSTHTGSTYTSLFIYINMNCLEFCKKEYSNIMMINDLLIELTRDNMIYSHIQLTIVTKDKINIEFDTIDNAVRIYDRYESGMAWGETIEEFIKRSSY